MNDETAAEDVVSDVFLAVWRRAGRFEGRAQVSTWLFGIARHKVLSLLRKRTSDPLDDEVAESIEDPADNPEVTMQKEQRRMLLQDCLTQLRRRIARSSTSSTTTEKRSRRPRPSSAYR
jgi:RNA polymerase sigma-70 factor (ECF subfamily)